MKLDLGCGPHKAQDDFLGVDCRDFKGVSVVCDLERSWPFKDNSITEVRASHIFEHLPEPLHTMSELFRTLQPGGKAEIDIPSSNGPGAFQDPTHKSFWNLNSFIYYNRLSPLGAMYSCNQWDVLTAQEYMVPGIEAFGPYVKAIMRKPDDAC